MDATFFQKVTPLAEPMYLWEGSYPAHHNHQGAMNPRTSAVPEGWVPARKSSVYLVAILGLIPTLPVLALAIWFRLV